MTNKSGGAWIKLDPKVIQNNHAFDPYAVRETEPAVTSNFDTLAERLIIELDGMDIHDSQMPALMGTLSTHLVKYLNARVESAITRQENATYDIGSLKSALGFLPHP